jgi:NADPH2:quinone reductase
MVQRIRAIRIHAYGGPEVMQLEEVPLPALRAGEAVVRVHAASVNFLDVQKRRGELVGRAFYHRADTGEPDLPATLGSQGVGVVEAVGLEVSNVAIGDRVSFAGESYASHAVVPAMRLIGIPEGISFEQAAAGMNQGFLAYAFTHFAYPVKAGDWCLIQAAAGGQGVSVVYDGVGKDTFAANLESLAPGGYLIIYGQSSGYVPPFDLMTLQEKGSLFLTRTNGLPYLKEYPHYLELFVDWVKQGKLSIKIDRTHPLAEAALAHAAFEQRQVSGRVLLLP